MDSKAKTRGAGSAAYMAVRAVLVLVRVLYDMGLFSLNESLQRQLAAVMMSELTFGAWESLW